MNNSSEPVTTPKTNIFSQLWGGLTDPPKAITDIGARQQGRLVASLSLGSTALFLMALIATVSVHKQMTTVAYFSLIPALAFVVIAYALSRTGLLNLGAWLLTLGISASAYGQILSGGDVFSAMALNVSLALLLGSAILSARSLLLLFIGNMTVSIILLGYSMVIRPLADAAIIGQGIGAIIAFGGVLLIVVTYRNNVERYRLDELKKTNTELNDIRQNLENRVEERTNDLNQATDDARRRSSQLEAVSKVATTIAQVEDINELLPTITRQISEHLGLYHVGIFLLDEKREYAVLMAANSEGGQRMLQHGHKLKVGQVGIVGFVSERGIPHISTDVGLDAIFFNNPSLPNTRSEMALPLIVGNQLIGVLDVQSEKTSAFVQQDIDVMSTLSNQVAVAIINAKRFSDTRQALSEARTLYNQYIRDAWQDSSEGKPSVGYQYINGIAKPLTKSLDRSDISSALTSGRVVVKSDETPTLAIPLKVRDEIIGVLNVSSSTANRQWGENEKALVQAVADRVALALENARLFEETTRRANRERTVSEITTQIRSATDPEVMLHTALEELKRALKAKDIQVRPYSPPTNKKPDEQNVIPDSQNTN
ncbi:MAG TPA: GAF domain-containing protein [Anaerolineales bacterium]|nr:GAF domain-containing protein [Anaerolineales bacterium]